MDYIKAQRVLDKMIIEGKVTREFKNGDYKYYDKNWHQLATIYSVGDETFLSVQEDSFLELMNKQIRRKEIKEGIRR